MVQIDGGDHTSIAVPNDEHLSLEEELEGQQLPPQFGRMLAEFGIRYIAAGSPEAKGRIERLWRTLQDRLLKEMLMKGIRTLEAAMAFLPGFLVRIDEPEAAGVQPPARQGRSGG